MTPEEVVQQIKQSGAFDQLREQLLTNFKETSAHTDLCDQIATIVNDLADNPQLPHWRNRQFVLNKVQKQLEASPVFAALRQVINNQLIPDTTYQAALHRSVDQAIDQLANHASPPPPLSPSVASASPTAAAQPLSSKPPSQDASALIRSLLGPSTYSGSKRPGSTRPTQHTKLSSLPKPPLAVGQLVAAFIPLDSESTTAPDPKSDRCLLVSIADITHTEPRYTIRDISVDPHDAQEEWRVSSSRIIALTTAEHFAVRDMVFAVFRDDGDDDFTTELYRGKVAKVGQHELRVKFFGGDSCNVPLGKAFKLSRIVRPKPTMVADTALPIPSTSHADIPAKLPAHGQTAVPSETPRPKDAIKDPLITTTTSPTLPPLASKPSSPMPSNTSNLTLDAKVKDALDVSQTLGHELGDDALDHDEVSSLSSLASDMFESMDIEDP
ncbi:hypothetical protein H4R34_001504 [Dimargaris verticillata]|uniref:SGF29 C-terminal domain-containing protein n=1 Tax=Dimargaris verticillata TaxID=2761393 RepID=A0A9W8EA85_9FUNG|nr:hypothetical protein H4R34_001504 [Dimargaris verticillata]